MKRAIQTALHLSGLELAQNHMCFIMDPDACDSPSMITIYLLLKSTPPHSEKAILQYGNRYDGEPSDFKRIGSDALLQTKTWIFTIRTLGLRQG